MNQCFPTTATGKPQSIKLRYLFFYGTTLAKNGKGQNMRLTGRIQLFWNQLNKKNTAGNEFSCRIFLPYMGLIPWILY